MVDEESLEGIIRNYWEMLAKSVFDKFERLSHGLLVWAKDIKKKRVGFKRNQ